MRSVTSVLTHSFGGERAREDGLKAWDGRLVARRVGFVTSAQELLIHQSLASGYWLAPTAVSTGACQVG